MSSPFDEKEPDTSLDVVDEISELVQQTVEYCRQNEIANPVEILRYYQKVMVLGRPLNVEDQSQAPEGSTNYIMVDRYNLIPTAFNEINALTNLRKTLEVQFYGEVSINLRFLYTIY